MNYIMICLVILSGLVIVAPVEARWIDIGSTNDGSTLGYDTKEPGRTRFIYRIRNGNNMEVKEGVTNWCYRGKIRRNPNAADTTPTPGWYVYNENDITSVYANSEGTFYLLKTICENQ